MNETDHSAPATDISTDGEAPRLGGARMLPNVAPVAAPVLDATPALPLVSPVLSTEATPMLPNVGTPSPLPAPMLSDEQTPLLPLLPNPSVGTPSVDLHLPSALIQEVVATAPEERRHPMAHLMPEVTKPSEAAFRAADARKAKKRKGKRNKIIGGVVFLAIAAVAGPPLAKWTIDAINESGSTKPDTPPGSAPASTLSPVDAMLTTPPTSAATATTTPAP